MIRNENYKKSTHKIYSRFITSILPSQMAMVAYCNKLNKMPTATYSDFHPGLKEENTASQISKSSQNLQAKTKLKRTEESTLR